MADDQTGGANSLRARRKRVPQDFVQVSIRLHELISQHCPDLLPKVEVLTEGEMRALAEEAHAVIVHFKLVESGPRGGDSYANLVFPDGPPEHRIVGVPIPGFTAQDLGEMLGRTDRGQDAGDWMGCYRALQVAQSGGERPPRIRQALDRWQDVMDRTLGRLYDRLMGPVHQAIARRLTDQGRIADGGAFPLTRLVVVPERSLAVLPLHACWRQVNGRRRYLIDDYVISYAPNWYIFKRCLDREKRARRDNLLGIVNPKPPGNLLFAEWAGEEIRGLALKVCTLLSRHDATKANLRASLAQNPWHWVHFDCHGEYMLNTPWDSELRLANGESVPLWEFYEQLDLPEAWLVVLSACETGLVNPDRPDELDFGTFSEFLVDMLRFYTAFIVAGAPTVFATLWMVRDLASSLMMMKVYNDLQTPGASKPGALRDAQRWLQTLTARDVLERVRARERELNTHGQGWTVARARRYLEAIPHPDDHIFARPYYWAGFQCVGV